MALATSSADGVPSNRFVLLKGFDQQGFVFYTNSRSQKGREIAANPRAALAFRWSTVNRQVRVAGTVAPLDATESDAYFATRSRWCSGRRLGVGAERGARVARRPGPRGGRGHRAALPGGKCPDRPGGAAFGSARWKSSSGRAAWTGLHDRLVYRQVGGRWRIYRLNP